MVFDICGNTYGFNTMSQYIEFIFVKAMFKKVKFQFDLVVDSIKVVQLEVECIKVCNRFRNYLLAEWFNLEFLYHIKSSSYQAMRPYTACYIELHL